MKNRVTTPGLIAMSRTLNCSYCDKVTTIGNFKKHELSCFNNPSNVKYCLVCSKVIKNYKTSRGTCSRSCANTLFRSGENNPNWKGKYQSICFKYHEKKCVVCGENKIVAVHHYDHNHNNNDPKNLIPLCPTHHTYVHSRFACEVLPIIEKYKLSVG